MPQQGPPPGLCLTPRALAEMGARARTLDERLGDPASAPASRWPWADDPLARWCRAFAPGDHAALARRLAWDGWSEEAARAALLRADAVVEGAPPDWALDLCAAYQAASATDTADPELEAAPFAPLWRPLVAWADRLVNERAPGWRDLLRPAARARLQRHLLEQLASIALLATLERFDRFRAAATGAPGPPAEASRREGHDLYDAFVADLLGGGLADHLCRHPVLARHLWRLSASWVESTVELVERLATDLPTVAEAFAAGLPPGAVTALEPGLSDRHHGGRQVLALTFASGLELVYKPRAVDLEAAFAELVAWLGRAGLDPPPAAAHTLARPGYGWAERVRHREARSLEGVRAWHHRAGSLLCLAWVLGASDLHMDNVVAGPDGPVLVDLETLLQPRPATSAAAPVTAIVRAAEQLRASFLATGLISFLTLDPEGRPCDIGGLTGRGGHLAEPARRVLRHPNRDGMHLDRERAYAPPERNLVSLDGEVQGPERFPDQVADGFAAAYRLLLARCAELEAADGPLARFASARTRLVPRPSQSYALLQLLAASPAYQRDGFTRALLIEALNRPHAKSLTRPVLWPLSGEERRALEALDLPRFEVAVDSTTIHAPNGEAITGHLERSGMGCVRERMDRLGVEDLARQLDLLRSCLLPPRPDGPAAHLVDGATADPTPLHPGKPRSPPRSSRQQRSRSRRRSPGTPWSGTTARSPGSRPRSFAASGEETTAFPTTCTAARPASPCSSPPPPGSAATAGSASSPWRRAGRSRRRSTTLRPRVSSAARGWGPATASAASSTPSPGSASCSRAASRPISPCGWQG